MGCAYAWRPEERMAQSQRAPLRDPLYSCVLKLGCCHLWRPPARAARPASNAARRTPPCKVQHAPPCQTLNPISPGARLRAQLAQLGVQRVALRACKLGAPQRGLSVGLGGRRCGARALRLGLSGSRALRQRRALGRPLGSLAKAGFKGLRLLVVKN